MQPLLKSSSLAVSTQKIRISSTNGVTIDTGTSSVNVTTEDSKTYKFEAASQGDELDPDTGEGTFTLVHIVYNDTSGAQKWSLDIPVYVEKRLKIHSNMRMLPGIQYDTNKVKTTGKYTTDSNPNLVLLPMGTSYTIY